MGKEIETSVLYSQGVRWVLGVEEGCDGVRDRGGRSLTPDAPGVAECSWFLAIYTLPV